MKKFILFLLLWPAFVLAQKKALTERAVTAVNTDSVKVASAIIEARKMGINFDKRTPEVFQHIIDLCQGKTSAYFLNTQGEAVGAIAVYYKNVGRYDAAAMQYNKLMKFGLDNKMGSLVAKANIGLGLLADYRSDYETAISKNLLALKYFESVRDSSGMASALGNMGNAYIRLDQHEKAIQYLDRCGEIFMKKKMASAVANYYANLARAYKGLRNYQKEEELKLKAFAIFNAEKNKKGIATVSSTLGSFYISQGKLDQALKYYTLSLKTSWQMNDIGNIAILHCNLAHLYTKLREPERAIMHADSAAYYSKKSGDRLAQAEAALVKGVLLHIKRETLTGAEFIDRYTSLRDSIYNTKMQSRVADMEVKYQTAKKENEITLLYIANNNKELQLKNSELELNKSQLQITEQNQALTINELRLKNQDQKLVNQKLDAEKRNERIKTLKKQSLIRTLEIANRDLNIRQKNLVLGGIFVLMVTGCAIGFTIYNRYKSRQTALLQQQRIEQQERLTQAIISAEEKERSRIASDLHDGVGQLFSAVKSNLGGLLDRVTMKREEDRFLAEKTMALVEESCKEVRGISNQMMPNIMLRSGLASDVKSFIEKIDPERLKVTVNAVGFKDKLESNVEVVLYRVIQETVNNVIKHAKATLLDIKLVREEAGISAVIADNGIGFNAGQKGKFDGIGLKNIATRIAYLKGYVNYTSAPGEGTTVNLWVPVI